ncbi:MULTISPECIES: hypothetical protein [unclassified Mesorhizobium]|uniref:hypothetical protein n=1 Tax=unclassified Mesorhizobium TaxID=325217 RepID=UPI0004CE994A|nr:hypothetical protein [Mesorhizobium sp. LSJC268A00]
MIWLLVPHHLAEIAFVDLLTADRACLVTVLRLVWLAGDRRSKVGYSSHARPNKMLRQSSVNLVASVGEDIAPKAVVIWSTVEMRLQSAVRHGGRCFHPIKFDRRLSGLISVDEIGNLQSGEISAPDREPPWTKYSQHLRVTI